MARTFGNAVFLASALTACASWPVVPASGQDEGPRVQTTLTEDRFVVNDARTGTIIIDSDDVGFHQHLARRRAALEPLVTIQPVADGFDAVFTFENNRGIPMPLGALAFTGLNLSDGFQWRDFNRDGGLEPVDRSDPRASFRFGYPHRPNGHYAPVAVMETDDHVIGFSLLYPVLEFRHEIVATLARERGDDGWKMVWKLSNFGSEGDRAAMSYEATLRPGERRSYTVAVRITTNHERWIETLEPYQRFFRSTYGGVTYPRDPRPVKAVSFAGEGNLSNRNPYGFRQEDLRPDLYGWGPILEWLETRFTLAPRMMFWQPTGLQRRHPENNFPFKFASFWLEGSQHGHRMGDAPQQFRDFARRTGVEVAFWWGQSTRVTSRWDVAGYENLDPNNPQHVALGFREIDAAASAGAKTIGLDAFGDNSETPAWELVRWIQMLRERHPDITFVTEKHKPDILHRLGPTFFQAYNKGIEAPRTVADMRLIDEPYYLADFLLPGHETWLSLRTDLLERVPGFRVTDHFVHNEYQRAMELGYVPVFYAGIDPDASDLAAETWLHTVPAGLRASPPVADTVPQAAVPTGPSPVSRSAPSSSRVGSHKNPKNR